MSSPARDAMIVMVLSLLCASVDAQQPDSVRMQFDVESQPLPEALTAWAEQAELQLIWPTGTSATTLQLAPRINGRFAPEEALSLLLRGSGLTYSFVDEQTVAIRKSSASAAGQIGSLQDDILRVAASEPIPLDRSDSVPSEKDQPNWVKSGEGADPKQTESLEEIVVTGTHIRGVSDLPMPTIVFTREDIDRTGYSKTEDLFKSLPQNLAGITPAGSVSEGATDLALANSEKVTGIDLRGLGPQSTLVLLNGQRRASSVQGRTVDVSAIPLSVIERVEIVTGGRSAIYGSDAVAGVVNLLTRRDFDGAESRAYYGEAGAGAERLQLSQAYGRHFDRSGFVAAYDYSNDGRLDATEAGVVHAPSIFDLTPIPGEFDLIPDSSRHSGFLSGRLAVGERAELYADGLYSSSDVSSVLAYSSSGFDYVARNATKTDQYSIAPGAHLTLNDTWRADVSGVYGKVTTRGSFVDPFTSSEGRAEAGLSSVSAVLDGIALSTPHFEIKTAVGAESRWESFKDPAFLIHSDRTVQSVFAEALVSLWPADTGRHRLELSIAGRYSDYSDFGGSVDPQLGVSWAPAAGIALRGAYSTAFRAPDLYALNDAYATQLLLINQSDATQGGAAVPTALWFGNNSKLKPEEATTWSVGFDYTLPFAPDASVAVSYFDIQYDKRIDIPASGGDRFAALSNEERYPGLIDRNPSSEQLQAILNRAIAQQGVGNVTGSPFDPNTQTLLEAFPNLVLFDDRTHNVASETMRGLDLSLSDTFKTNIGTFSLGFNGAYYFAFKRKVTSRSPAISQLDAPSKPVHFRLRANAGWTRSSLGAFVYLNYVDSYEDTFAFPVTGISSWTTVDTTLRLDGSQVATSGLLHGLSATLSIMNLFDRVPPHFANNTFGLAYDPVNADALGRFISLGLVKEW